MSLRVLRTGFNLRCISKNSGQPYYYIRVKHLNLSHFRPYIIILVQTRAINLRTHCNTVVTTQQHASHAILIRVLLQLVIVSFFTHYIPLIQIAKQVDQRSSYLITKIIFSFISLERVIVRVYKYISKFWIFQISWAMFVYLDYLQLIFNVLLYLIFSIIYSIIISIRLFL